MALFEFGDYSYQEITLKEKLLEVLSYLLRIGDFKQYAGKTNYFVTCDYALSSQAMEIYRYLGCKTNVIYCEKKAPDPSLPLAVLCKKTATP